MGTGAAGGPGALVARHAGLATGTEGGCVTTLLPQAAVTTAWAPATITSPVTPNFALVWSTEPGQPGAPMALAPRLAEPA